MTALTPIGNRVASNLRLAREVFHWAGNKRLAGRYLFSSLGDLEQIALMAAQRGGGIAGQLEDEMVHRETFDALAKSLGGRVAPSRAVAALTDFIEDLSGPVLLAVLNIVAERWLGTVFKHVARWGLAPELFSSIEQEERRHSHEALSLARPAPDDALPYLRELEQHLCRITVDPSFMYPLAYLSSLGQVSEMGQEIAEVHRESSRLLGVEPTAYLGAMISCAVDAGQHKEPELLELTPWQRTRFNVDFVAPIYGWISVPAQEHQGRALLEMEVARSTSRALASRPECHVTLNPYRRQLYRPVAPVVALRRLYDRRGQVISLHFRDAHQHSARVLLESASRKKTTAQLLPFPELPELGELRLISPPPRTAATITNLLDCGFDLGMPTLAGVEGASLALGLASVRDGRLHIGVAADHRALDGGDLGLFLTAFREAWGYNGRSRVSAGLAASEA